MLQIRPAGRHFYSTFLNERATIEEATICKTEQERNLGKKPTLWTKNFTIITLGTVISATGGTAMNMALGLVVFDNTGSPFMTGLFEAVSILPTVILPILLSPYIDSHSRRNMIVWLDGLAAVVALGFAVTVTLTGFTFTNYLIYGVLAGAIGSVYGTAYQALYPDLIPEGFMQKGYSISSLIYPTMTVVIVPVAAIVYSKFGIEYLIYAQSLLLAVACAFETQIRVDEKQICEKQKFNLKEYLGRLAGGFRYLKNEKGVRSLYAYMAVTNAAGSGTNLMTLSFYQSSPVLTTAMYSLLISAETLGRMMGGIVHYFAKIPPGRKYKIAESVYITYDLFDGILLFLPFYGMAANRFICGFLGVNSATLREAAIQNYLPPEIRGRVSSLLNVTISAGVMLMQLIAGALGEVLPYRGVAVICASLALTSVFLLVRRNRKSIEALFLAPAA
jgi:MFS family permease